MFLGVFKANSMFLPPPWKILPSPRKKSADAHGQTFSLAGQIEKLK
jgi:hypothetical protein